MILKNKIKKIKGFTLVEVIIAMFVFVLVISSATVVFSYAFRNYSDAKDMQENMENAQYAMNLMAKTFRTSSVADDGPGYVVVFDYSQEKCLRYQFNGTELRRAEDTGASDLSGCQSSSFSGVGDLMTSGDVMGSFQVTRSDGASTPPEVGKIVISMELSKGNSVVRLQTTASLRDYVESGISL